MGFAWRTGHGDATGTFVSCSATGSCLPSKVTGDAAIDTASGIEHWDGITSFFGGRFHSHHYVLYLVVMAPRCRNDGYDAASGVCRRDEFARQWSIARRASRCSTNAMGASCGGDDSRVRTLADACGCWSGAGRRRDVFCRLDARGPTGLSMNVNDLQSLAMKDGLVRADAPPTSWYRSPDFVHEVPPPR